jgi:hypothetical protein
MPIIVNFRNLCIGSIWNHQSEKQNPKRQRGKLIQEILIHKGNAKRESPEGKTGKEGS